MKIGIIRHFKVNYKPKLRWMDSEQFDKWIEEYNNSEIIPLNNIGNNGDWDICFSSDLKRAEYTAKLIYDGIIIKTKDLREIGIKTFFKTKIKFHHIIWLITNRIIWYFSKESEGETKNEAILRAKRFIDLIEVSDYSKILVVSHGLFMKYLNKELKQRKYKGRMKLFPKNGKLIIYKK